MENKTQYKPGDILPPEVVETLKPFPYAPRPEAKAGELYVICRPYGREGRDQICPVGLVVRLDRNDGSPIPNFGGDWIGWVRLAPLPESTASDQNEETAILPGVEGKETAGVLVHGIPPLPDGYGPEIWRCVPKKGWVVLTPDGEWRITGVDWGGSRTLCAAPAKPKTRLRTAEELDGLRAVFPDGTSVALYHDDATATLHVSAGPLREAVSLNSVRRGEATLIDSDGNELSWEVEA